MRLQNREIGFVFPGDHHLTGLALQELKKLKQEGAKLLPLVYGSLTAQVEKELKAINGASLQEIDLEASLMLEYPFDLLVFAPCTPSVVELLLKSKNTPCIASRTSTHLQSPRPVVIALCGNGHSAKLMENIQALLMLHDIYIVPFTADANQGNSLLVTRMELLTETCIRALTHQQLQPVFLEKITYPH